MTTKAFNDRVADWVKGRLSPREVDHLLNPPGLEEVRSALLDLECRTLVHHTNAKKRIAMAKAAGDYDALAERYHALAGIKTFRGALFRALRDVNRRLRDQRRDQEARSLRQLVDWLVSLDQTVAELEDDCPERLKDLLDESFERLAREQRRSA